MKVITIVTHEIEYEIKKINPYYDDTPFEICNGEKKIEVIRKKKSVTESELGSITTGDGSENENILLYHLTNQQFTQWDSPKFDIGTKGAINNKTADRINYEMLLNANTNNTYNWVVFEQVWNYFSKKVEQLQLKKSKENYFNKCIAESKWEELPELFATPRINEKWNEIKEKPFDSQSPDYNDFYKLFEDN